MTEEQLREQFPDATIGQGISVVTMRVGDTQLSKSFNRHIEGSRGDAMDKLAADAHLLGLGGDSNEV